MLAPSPFIFAASMLIVLTPWSGRRTMFPFCDPFGTGRIFMLATWLLYSLVLRDRPDDCSTVELPRWTPIVVNFLAMRMRAGTEAETRARQTQNSSITIVGTRSMFVRPWRMKSMYSARWTQRGIKTLGDVNVGQMY